MKVYFFAFLYCVLTRTCDIISIEVDDYMRIKKSISKSNTYYSIIKDYTNVNGKRSTKIVENLGNQFDIEARFGKDNTFDKINEYIKSLEDEKIIVHHSFDSSKRIPLNTKLSFNCGYLFLQSIYYSIGIDKICNKIEEKYKFTFDLNEVLSNLIYSRIIWPASKLSTYRQSQNFLEKPSFELQHIYRALQYLSQEFDLIQEELFSNSSKIIDRNYKVIYYDCTNFFFYTEEDEFRRYGISKQHQPLPLVQMGLFMDADGLPIALNINPGNTSEQKTLIGTETKIVNNFSLKGKNIIICTDGGLASDDNKLFNTKDGRGFIITQSIKKLKQETKDWVFDNDGWRILGDMSKIYNLEEIKNNEELSKKYYETIFYKEKEYDTDKVKQALIVTFSLKYQAYHQNIRKKQLERAYKIIDSGEKIKTNKNQNDPKRFIKVTHSTKDGKKAEKEEYSIDLDKIAEETKYDGYYGVTTNLIDDTEKIVKVSKGRWEIEESFRIMKDDFDSGTVYLSREDRIKAHFITCFISLFIYRLLEKKLDNNYTSSEILKTLKEMNVRELKGDGYIPTYERTTLTDDLNNIFGLNIDREIITYKKIKKFLRHSKTGN